MIHPQSPPGNRVGIIGPSPAAVEASADHAQLVERIARRLRPPRSYQDSHVDSSGWGQRWAARCEYEREPISQSTQADRRHGDVLRRVAAAAGVTEGELIEALLYRLAPGIVDIAAILQEEVRAA
jgi:hypothetical protein